ncbi:hypothetical protein [Acinetobacter sp. CFCC 11171]|uniref:hypothetical protein n=1 Tax=Acinetobacter sp. CFCC 11171 TaxID=1775558 RepID=UPI0013A6E0BA|nr:hypothetical protein [Acinetobacter sp. CFCC 11171]
MTRTTIIKYELSLIPNKDQYSIRYSINGQQWIHNMTHEHLIDASDFLNKIAIHGSIDLLRWTKTTDNFDFILLVNKLKLTKNKMHIWNGQDSYCTMWGTGGLKQDRHILTDTPPADVFCSTCVDQYRRHVPKENQKIFDVMYRLKPEDQDNVLENDIDPSLF